VTNWSRLSIQQAIRAGIKVIEHGQLADEDTVRMMAEKGIWWSLNGGSKERKPVYGRFAYRDVPDEEE
jgi:imidazolonepropionase-like amidohydrolase